MNNLVACFRVNSPNTYNPGYINSLINAGIEYQKIVKDIVNLSVSRDINNREKIVSYLLFLSNGSSIRLDTKDWILTEVYTQSEYDSITK